MTPAERVANYHRVTGFPESLFVGGDGRIVGTFIMGNDYRVKSKYYGGFPGDTVDLNADLAPDYVDDAQTLERVPLERYDLVMADPPYSVEDCEHYGTPMINRNKVVAALGARLTTGCHVVWLDQALPMYLKDQFAWEGAIGMWKSTNHRFRGITIFKRHDAGGVA